MFRVTCDEYVELEINPQKTRSVGEKNIWKNNDDSVKLCMSIHKCQHIWTSLYLSKWDDIGLIQSKWINIFAACNSVSSIIFCASCLPRQKWKKKTKQTNGKKSHAPWYTSIARWNQKWEKKKMSTIKIKLYTWVESNMWNIVQQFIAHIFAWYNFRCCDCLLLFVGIFFFFFLSNAVYLTCREPFSSMFSPFLFSELYFRPVFLFI